jgi:hypothetical protein
VLAPSGGWLVSEGGREGKVLLSVLGVEHSNFAEFTYVWISSTCQIDAIYR